MVVFLFDETNNKSLASSLAMGKVNIEYALPVCFDYNCSGQIKYILFNEIIQLFYLNLFHYII